MFFKYSRTVIRTETRQTGKLKNPLNKMISGNKAVPEVIRTPDLPLRRRSLYPAELRKHKKLKYSTDILENILQTIKLSATI